MKCLEKLKGFDIIDKNEIDQEVINLMEVKVVIRKNDTGPARCRSFFPKFLTFTVQHSPCSKFLKFPIFPV